MRPERNGWQAQVLQSERQTWHRAEEVAAGQDVNTWSWRGALRLLDWWTQPRLLSSVPITAMVSSAPSPTIMGQYRHGCALHVHVAFDGLCASQTFFPLRPAWASGQKRT